jgi:sulfur carrier protein
MMNLTVNGESRELEPVATVAAALKALGYEGESFAVALNGDFVPRSHYTEQAVKDGDQLEVLFPMRGG